MTRREQLSAFIGAIVDAARPHTGRIGMADDLGECLAAFRAFNYERISQRPASNAQARVVIRMLRALVEHFADRPNLLDPEHDREIAAGGPEAFRAAVTHIGGMTDRFARNIARTELGSSLGWER